MEDKNIKKRMRETSEKKKIINKRGKTDGITN